MMNNFCEGDIVTAIPGHFLHGREMTIIGFDDNLVNVRYKVEGSVYYLETYFFQDNLEFYKKRFRTNFEKFYDDYA